MPTKSQIDRAGERLRKAETPSEADREVYNEYRAAFAEPLGEVVVALRELADGAPVTSRLKRFETTIEKLRRHKSRLSSIEDIAGCRVVLPTMRHQHELLDRIRRELDVVRERDYQANPRGGYRALHAVVRAGGPLVEVQLRTDLEDQWANTVEKLAGKLDPEIKYDDGPPGLHRRLEIISKIISELDEIKAIRHRLDLVETIQESRAESGASSRTGTATPSPPRPPWRAATEAALSSGNTAMEQFFRILERDITVADSPDVGSAHAAWLQAVVAWRHALENLIEIEGGGV